MNYFGELRLDYYGKWQELTPMGRGWFLLKVVFLPYWVIFKLLREQPRVNLAFERKIFYADHHGQDLLEVDEVLRQLVPGYEHHQKQAPAAAVRAALEGRPRQAHGRNP